MTDKRSLPRNDAAEQYLLAVIIARPWILDELNGFKPELFYDPANRIIFSYLAPLEEAHGVIDFQALKNTLARDGKLAEVGGEQYLDGLWEISGKRGFDEMPKREMQGTWKYHLGQVEEAYRRRAVILECRKLEEAMFDPATNDLEAVTEHAERALTALATKTHRPPKAFKDHVLDTIHVIEDRHAKRFTPSGARFGIPDLDEELGGLQAGDFCLISAETSGGKSAMAMQSVLHTAKGGGHVALFSLEMPATQIVERMIACRVELSMKRIRSGFLTEYDFPKLTNAAAMLHQYPISLEDSFTLDIAGVVSRCRQLHARQPLALVVIDYLQLLDAGANSKEDRREREVAMASNRCKKLAGELGCPVIALSQLNDQGKIRESRVPSHDADELLKIVDPENEANPHERFIVIGKQRNGPRGQTIPVEFWGEFMQFRSIEKRKDDNR